MTPTLADLEHGPSCTCEHTFDSGEPLYRLKARAYCREDDNWIEIWIGDGVVSIPGPEHIDVGVLAQLTLDERSAAQLRAMTPGESLCVFLKVGVLNP